MATRTPYLLDNAAPEASTRLSALATMFDANTQRHLRSRGIAPGWQCLEIGGGNGSIATWLADTVGETGRVVATDLDTRHLARCARPNLEVLRHDVRTDPLPLGTFDLVHVRLVLVHLPEWAQVLERLIASLKPGGWLVDEEFDSDSLPPDPSMSPGEVRSNTYDGLARLMAHRGFDRRFGRRLPRHLRDAGLTDVGAEGRLEMLDHRSAGTSLVRANYVQLRPDLVDGGYVAADEFEHDLRQLDAPDFMMPSSILWTAWGRRPGGDRQE